MSELFSDEWMKSFQTVWNADEGIADELEMIGFKSTIGYGFKGDKLNWDLRADKPTREKWIAGPPGMIGLGIAYTSKMLQFLVSGYGAMMKDPRIAGPFNNSFAAMGKA